MLFDLDTVPHDQAYKLVVSSVVPRPVAWVVSQDRQGVLNAAPYSFFNAFSSNPVVVAIGCGQTPDHRAKDTLANIEATGEFVVNLVSADLAEAMNITAVDFDAGVNEITEAGLTTLPSTKIKVPRIAESPVALECERLAAIDLGNERTLVIGRVLAMHIRDEAVLDPHVGQISLPDLVGFRWNDLWQQVGEQSLV